MKRTLLWAAVLSVVYTGEGFGNSLAGKVFDATSSIPIANAIVSTHILIPDSIGIFDTTDVSGSYSISSIPPGNQIYVIIAWAAGYRQYYLRLDDLKEGSFEFDIMMERESTPPPGGGDSSGVGGRILGHRGMEGSLTPLVGATVSFSSGGKAYTSTTDSGGAYQMKIPQGRYSVSISAQGYEPLMSSGVQVEPTGLSFGSVLHSVSTAVDDRSTGPASCALNEPYPNPFNPSTTISFTVGENSWVNLKVYDLLGRDVTTLVSGSLRSGSHAIAFNAEGLPSGVYFVMLTSLGSKGDDSFIATRRLVLLR